MRKLIALMITAVTALALGAFPALGADSGSTTTTFTLESTGALTVNVPTDEDLGTLDVSTLGTVTGSLTGSFANTVIVSDTRGDLVATWTATISTSDANSDSSPDAFVLTTLPDGSTTGIDTTKPNQRIEPGEVTYYPDGDPSGVGTLAENLISSGASVSATSGDLNADGTADASVSYTGVGNNEIEWTPYLDFTIDPDEVAGDYQGTIVHSVS